MGCNCKAANHITRVKNKYGYEMPMRKNVSVANKIKMALQAILIWCILILMTPVLVIVIVLGKIFKKDIKFLKKIKIRL
jgi:hypothetical protein